jgi:hypothetical protein
VNKPHALTLALVLAITAPDRSRASDCVAMAEQLARGMTPEQVEACKAQALELINNQ